LISIMPLDYIFQILLPRVKKVYEIEGGGMIDIKEEPYAFTRKGREWATVSYYVNHGNIHTVFVTMVSEYTLILSLDSPPAEQSRNQKLLDKTLNSIVFTK
jgi:hypothetical protein